MQGQNLATLAMDIALNAEKPQIMLTSSPANADASAISVAIRNGANADRVNCVSSVSISGRCHVAPRYSL